MNPEERLAMEDRLMRVIFSVVPDPEEAQAIAAELVPLVVFRDELEQVGWARPCLNRKPEDRFAPVFTDDLHPRQSGLGWKPVFRISEGAS